MIIVVLAVLIYNWCQDRRKKLEKIKTKNLLLSRLKENWSTVLRDESVDGLSLMPEEWKSSIVPVHSETGEMLNTKLKYMAKQIQGSQRRSRLLALRTQLRDFTDTQIAPFFASRHRLYKSCLLHDTNTQATAVGPNTRMQPESSHGPWPKNTKPLFRQVMFLLRELDNMFKASYNQRFDLRIMVDELTAYTEWMTNQLPRLMPHDFVLTQNTPRLFELYRQAAGVHSYYNKVCKRIAKKVKATWHPSPLKKMFRILEKATYKKRNMYMTKAMWNRSPLKTVSRVLAKAGQKHISRDSGYFDCSKIFDIVRGTFVFDTLADEDGGVLRGIRAVFECGKFQVIRVKDRFSNPTSGCWRDVLINARMVSGDGTIQSHIVEIQFHQKDLREERMNVGGHYIYERHRALFEACEVACGDEASAKLQDLHSALPSVSAMSKIRKEVSSMSRMKQLLRGKKDEKSNSTTQMTVDALFNTNTSRVHPAP